MKSRCGSPPVIRTLALLACLGLAARANDPAGLDWRPFSGPQSGVVSAPGDSAVVLDFAVHDDGSGPALFVSGLFSTAGATPAACIAKWNGEGWSPLGSGLSLQSAGGAPLLSVDTGAGRELVIGGSFSSAGGTSANNVASWTGSSWRALGAGLNGSVVALARRTSGPGFFAGGEFQASGSVPLGRVALWDGQAWVDVGGGVMGARVTSLATQTVAGVEHLIVGGDFSSAGGVAANNIARWDGQSWSAFGAGLGGGVSSLAIFDDGSGEALYAGSGIGFFSVSPPSSVAKWNGSQWVSVGSLGLAGGVSELVVLDDGSGPVLFACGALSAPSSGGAHGIARWDGVNWSGVGGGVAPTLSSFVSTACAFDDGSGSQFFIGGRFDRAGSALTNNLARSRNGAFEPISPGFTRAVGAAHSIESGPAAGLYFGGGAMAPGGIALGSLARWDGQAWSNVGGALTGSVIDLGSFHPAIHEELIAVGTFTLPGATNPSRVARWDGAVWVDMTAGLNNTVYRVASRGAGAGAQLFVSGPFNQASSGLVFNLARWTGASWAQVGSGLGGWPRGLAFFDSGAGPELYASGDFSVVGSPTVRYIARWDGTAWNSVGGGTDLPANALVTHDDGSGPALYVGGRFNVAGNILAPGIAKWDGAQWHALGVGISGPVNALASAAGGADCGLYAAGNFQIAGGQPARRLARWSNGAWTPLGAGLDVELFELAWSSRPGDEGIYVVGSFAVSPAGDSYVAHWSTARPESFCTPQAPSATNGCDSRIWATAHPSVDHSTVCELHADHIDAQRTGLFFYGVNGAMNQPWCANGSARLCVSGARQRLPAQDSGGATGQCDGALTLDWSAYQLATPGSLGSPWVAGAVVEVQAWFRDPLACRSSSLTPGVRLVYR